VDALVYSPRARYVFVARDGRDVVWSLYNHHARANDHWYALLNDTPGLVGPPMPRPPASIREYFNTWLARDGYPFWPFWDHVRGWWELRALPNLLLTHYADLKRDFPREARRIAEFLGLDADALRWDAILEHCSFDYMKRNAAAVAPLGGGLWDGGAGTFIHKGTNGRWRDTLSDEEVARYEATARERLGEDCARWLATGELP
ncbi:MAG: sulfotransferase domain-containing protein, partial [Myxococcales bacterium]|nr:sulfotransferase domain-containing protein [Myxococcales bacterium]